MGYPYYGQPYGVNPYGQPPYGGNPQQNPMMTIIACEQPVGLGGQQQIVPIQGYVNLANVAQQVVIMLMGQGFQAYPMVGNNMAVIQAQHSSLLGMLTDQNKAYTIRMCLGPGFVMVETGISNLMQELLVGAGTVAVSDEVLHNKLLTMLGGGVDAYGIYKDYVGEQQLIQMITSVILASQVFSQPPQPGYMQPYGQQPQYPSQQPPPYQGSAPPQYNAPPPVQSYNPQGTPPPQSYAPGGQTLVRCPSCGAQNSPGSKFCSSCGSSLTGLVCPSCGAQNSPGSKFCSSCGSRLVQAQQPAGIGPVTKGQQSQGGQASPGGQKTGP